MHTIKTTVAVFVIGLCSGGALAQAQTPKEIAGRIPLSVSEVIVGGQWGGEEADGAYRAVLLDRIKDGMPVADILVQWITLGEDGGGIAHSETITSIAGERASTTFIAFDFGDSDDENRLLIGSYDPETKKDDLRFVRLGGPGEFEFVSPPRSQQ